MSMSRPRNWPSREDWAYQRQHPYWDAAYPPFNNKLKHQLSDYATPEEIAALIAALKNLYRDKGREMRAAKLQANVSGFRWPVPYLEYRQWPEQKKEIANRLNELQWARRSINNVLAAICDDTFSIRDGTPCDDAMKLWRPIEERYDAAFAAAREEWERECEQIPIDDAAWEQELQRRRELEAAS